ncbi:MAG: DUF1361 domain-containing protein [Sphingobacteriales bacterium]|nr:MAG: DUF1361 domain-containing protein [Sphingobacteriales bacterium]
MNFIRTYNWLYPMLAFNISMVATRIALTGELTFVFIIWNLFLAGVPLYTSHKLELAKSKIQSWLYAAVWLLFFPNAMYIVTDLFHLHERPEIPLWFDLVLLLSAALNGVIMGYLSLYKIEKWLKTFVPLRYITPIIFAILFLCGYGIYLGRYLRWNSWDTIVQPYLLFADIVHHCLHPFRNMHVWTLSAVFAIWMYLLYTHFKKIKLQ